MELYRPRSFLKLVLIGFTLVAVPLILGLVNATSSLDRLAEQSEKAVYQAAQVTQNSWLLVEQITGMERSARQYLVLREPALLRSYAETHRQFRATADSLSQLPLPPDQQAALRALAQEEQALFESLQRPPFGAAKGAQAATAFAVLMARAQAIAGAASHLIDREVASLQQAAARAQRVLAWQVLALIPGALIFAGVFTLLISRPIRQIEQAIKRLGEGQFGVPVTVSGPRDLERLGTQLDWLRRRLAALDEEKSKFLRHVSHELKTPLATIREGSELLADEIIGRLSPQQGEVSRILQHNAVHLQKLIEDLLNFNLAHGRDSSLEMAVLRLDDAVKDVLGEHKLFMLKKTLALDLNCAPVWIRADRQKLRIVLDNLLSNAIKFSPPGGGIRVALAAKGGRAVLDVSDTGPGIDADDRPRVFDAFYQGKAIAHGHVKGTGLGLAIAREYVLAHGGTIEIIPTGEIINASAGAHLRVTFALAESEMRHAS
jgi:two-component system sensor histidine kinase GlrK